MTNEEKYLPKFLDFYLEKEDGYVIGINSEGVLVNCADITSCYQCKLYNLMGRPPYGIKPCKEALKTWLKQEAQPDKSDTSLTASWQSTFDFKQHSCSNCDFLSLMKHDYCPKCGAKMNNPANGWKNGSKIVTKAESNFFPEMTTIVMCTNCANIQEKATEYCTRCHAYMGM